VKPAPPDDGMVMPALTYECRFSLQSKLEDAEAKQFILALIRRIKLTKYFGPEYVLIGSWLESKKHGYSGNQKGIETVGTIYACLQGHCY
jgi:hypothetical protein